MTNWKTKTIREATSLVKDGTHGTHKESPNGIPLLSAKDVNNGKIIFDNNPRLISRSEFDSIHRSYRLLDGDILLTIVGSLGRVAVVRNYTNNYTLQRSVAILRFNDTVYSQFAYHLLCGYGFQKELMKRESKGAQGGVYLGEIIKIKINLPEKPEQERIVSVLETWDNYLELLDKKIALKEQLKKGLMQQLLTGKKRYTDFNDKWVTVKLGDISRIKTGSKDNQNKVVGGTYPFFVRSPFVEQINSYSFDGEAILIPGEGNIGQIVHYINGKFDYHQRVYCISNFSNNLNGKYIYYYFIKNFAKQALKDSAKAAVDSLRLPTFTNFVINLPSFQEQNNIVKTLDIISSEINSLEQTKISYTLQKKYLLKNLITGTIRTPENLTKIGETL